MAFLDKLDQLYGTRNLYEVLQLDKTASEPEIKRAYRRTSLQVHPDRVAPEERAVATEKFQALSKVHSILSDQGKRDLYDESGEIDEEIVVQERDWDAYWRLLFKKITVEEIKEFERAYIGSEEERNDVKSAYVDYEGDMEKILENVLCCTVDDEGRLREIIEELIKKKEVPKFKAFTHESESNKRTRKKKVYLSLLCIDMRYSSISARYVFSSMATRQTPAPLLTPRFILLSCTLLHIYWLVLNPPTPPVLSTSA